MDDTYEIALVLKELKEQKVTPFFAFNEIRNILIEQKSYQEKEVLLLFLLKELDSRYYYPLFEAVALTVDPLLNRAAVYVFQEIIPNLSIIERASFMKQLLSPHYRFPADTKRALEEQGFQFLLTSADLLRLIEESQWQKILLFEREIAELQDPRLAEEGKKLWIAASELDAKLTRLIHGETISVTEGISLVSVLEKNPHIHA